MNEKIILETRGLTKEYGRKGFRTPVLKGIDLQIRQNDFVAIMGPSGSGKTTLLNMLSTIDRPTHGSVRLDGQELSGMKNRQLSRIRQEKIGFVFQDYSLLDSMNIEDNIALPLALHGMKKDVIEKRLYHLASLFGIQNQLKKHPWQLSGGQKQRAAAARALISQPEIIFADEPTGALDSRSGRELLEALENLNASGQATIVMVTHDAFAASFAREVYLLRDGKIVSRLIRGEDRRAFYDQIVEMQAALGSDFS